MFRATGAELSNNASKDACHKRSDEKDTLLVDTLLRKFKLCNGITLIGGKLQTCHSEIRYIDKNC